MLASSPGKHIEGVDKIFSFESIVEQLKEDTDLDADTNILDGVAVGSGKIWKITQASIRYKGTVPTSIKLDVQGLAGSVVLLEQKSPTHDQYYSWSGEVYMQVDDFLRLTVLGATLHDDAIMMYAGVQMNAP